jgi:hypothetical protein
VNETVDAAGEAPAIISASIRTNCIRPQGDAEEPPR